MTPIESFRPTTELNLDPKVESGVMRVGGRRRTCVLCDSELETAVVIATPGRSELEAKRQVAAIGCRDCGLVHVHSSRAKPFRPVPRSMPSARAEMMRRLLNLSEGQNVLEVGCNDGAAMAMLVASDRIRGHGIETHLGLHPGVPDALERLWHRHPLELELGADRFDRIAAFDWLAETYSPLASLIRLRQWLKRDGRLLLLVPNVLQPQGVLEEQFFTPQWRHAFSPSTLGALLQRAGLEMVELEVGRDLVVVARPAGSERPFESEMLGDAAKGGSWLAERLDAYRHLERVRLKLLQSGGSADLLASLVAILERPLLEAQLRTTVCALISLFGRSGALQAVRAIARAIERGPHAGPIKAECLRVAALYSRNPDEVETIG